MPHVYCIFVPAEGRTYWRAPFRKGTDLVEVGLCYAVSLAGWEEESPHPFVVERNGEYAAAFIADEGEYPTRYFALCCSDDEWPSYYGVEVPVVWEAD
jgi:hypothetical protein